jgi:hypothetical protein
MGAIIEAQLINFQFEVRVYEPFLEFRLSQSYTSGTAILYCMAI